MSYIGSLDSNTGSGGKGVFLILGSDLWDFKTFGGIPSRSSKKGVECECFGGGRDLCVWLFV